MALSNLKINKDPKAALSILLQLSLLVLSLSYALLYPPKAQAALTSLSVRFDRQSAGATLSGSVCVNTGTTGTENKVIVSFPSNFNIVGPNTSWTADTTAANIPGTAWTGGAGIGPVVVDTATKAAIFSVGDIAAGTNFCFHFTAGTSTVGTAGNDENGQVWTANTAAGGYIDNGLYATSIVTGTNGELISVTASVSGTFTFSLSPTTAIYGQTLPLGVLTSAAGGNTAPNQIQATVTTNAHNGYIAWIKSANALLHSAQVGVGSDIASVTGGTAVDLSASTGYGAFAYSTNGVIAAPFDGAVATHGTGNGTKVGQLHSTQFDQLASQTPGPIASQTFNVGVRARLTGTELPATDYSDTLTVVASGSF
jgi:hypothetical protein